MEKEKVHAAAPTVGERRYVTLLFADLSDSSLLAELLDEEDFSELLARLRRVAREVITRHGGLVARQQGDGLLAVFGAHETREDDGRRAIEAALELHAAVRRIEAGTRSGARTLAMHSGIHAGMLLITEGDIERGLLDVVGPVANTASRVADMARRDEVLVSAETLAPRQRPFFRITDLGPREIRGRSTGPLEVLRIDGAAGDEPQAQPLRPMDFIGRADELAWLQACAARARAGSCEVALVVGEPGVGKSRLVREFVRSLPTSDFQVLEGFCENYLGAEPLQPFLQWMRGEFGGGGEAMESAPMPLPPEAGAGAGAGAATRAASATPAALTGAIVELLGMLARQRTLVLVLDDWQWADDASRHALDAIVARHRGKHPDEPALPLLVVLGSRPLPPEELPLADARLDIQPLDADDAAAAIASRLPHAHPFTVQEIYRQSGGTPLFIEELCHAVGQGELHADQRRPGVAWINALVASRVSRLPPVQAELLRAAAVAGYAFPAWLLQSLAGEGAAAAVDALVAADFLVHAGEPGSLRFKHLLTREAVYATIAPALRRQLHLRAAEALEQAGNRDSHAERLELLAFHYDAAGVAAKAGRFAEAAGDKALAASALDRARTHFITALRALEAAGLETPDRQARFCKVAEKLGQACVFDPLDLRDGYPLLERALGHARSLGDTNTVARAEYWLAYMNYARGRPRESVQYAEAALEHAQASNDGKLARQLVATLGQALASAGRYDRALPTMDSALATMLKPGERPRGGAAIGAAYTLARRGYTLADIGRFDESDEAFAQSLALLGSQVHSVAASILEVKCVAHLWQGRWQEAAAEAARGADVALRCRSRWMVAMGRALGACARWGESHDLAAFEVLRESTQWIEDRGGAVSTSLNYGWLVEACVTLDRLVEARRHAARLFLRARAQDRPGEAIGCRALARAAAIHGDAARVRHFMAAAEEAAAQRGSPREQAMNLLAWSVIASVQGDAAQARARAQGAGEAFEKLGMPWYVAQAQHLLRSL
jgi:class 3 adenylate cyclase